MRGRGIWIALAILGLPLAAAASIWLGLRFAAPAGGPGTASANIGGPFELVNAQGETVRASDFAGRYRLIYFGYTYCPDICPTTLMDMTRALDRLRATAPDKAARITPIFISIDPKRDDPETVGQYTRHFHDRLVGLTGSPEQVARAAKAFHVYYETVKQGRPEGQYLVNHSSYIYLLGPQGRYIAHFSHKTEAAKLAQKLAAEVRS